MASPPPQATAPSTAAPPGPLGVLGPVPAGLLRWQRLHRGRLPTGTARPGRAPARPTHKGSAAQGHVSVPAALPSGAPRTCRPRTATAEGGLAGGAHHWSPPRARQAAVRAHPPGSPMGGGRRGGCGVTLRRLDGPGCWRGHIRWSQPGVSGLWPRVSGMVVVLPSQGCEHRGRSLVSGVQGHLGSRAASFEDRSSEVHSRPVTPSQPALGGPVGSVHAAGGSGRGQSSPRRHSEHAAMARPHAGLRALTLRGFTHPREGQSSTEGGTPGPQGNRGLLATPCFPRLLPPRTLHPASVHHPHSKQPGQKPTGSRPTPNLPRAPRCPYRNLG